MSERIEIGDLVIVVRVTHPCHEGLLGRIRRVDAIVPPQWYRCDICGSHSVAHGPGASSDRSKDGAVPLSWLKKIPPLVEPSHTERREEIEA
jgi:hypothetical protein